MSPDEEIAFTVATFQSVIRKGNNRVAVGLARREEAYDVLQRKETNYRTVWLQESVLRVMDALAEIALDFDAKHPDECCTAQDFGDILASTIAALRKL